MRSGSWFGIHALLRTGLFRVSGSALFEILRPRLTAGQSLRCLADGVSIVRDIQLRKLRRAQVDCRRCGRRNVEAVADRAEQEDCRCVGSRCLWCRTHTGDRDDGNGETRSRHVRSDRSGLLRRRGRTVIQCEQPAVCRQAEQVKADNCHLRILLFTRSILSPSKGEDDRIFGANIDAAIKHVEPDTINPLPREGGGPNFNCEIAQNWVPAFAGKGGGSTCLVVPSLEEPRRADRDLAGFPGPFRPKCRASSRIFLFASNRVAYSLSTQRH